MVMIKGIFLSYLYYNDRIVGITMKWKKGIVLTAKFGITLVLMREVIDRIDSENFYSVLDSVDYGYLSIAYVLAVMQIILGADRWLAVLKNSSIAVLRMDTVRWMWTGDFANQIIPSGLAGDAIKIYGLSNDDHNIMSVIYSVIIDRYYGVLGLVLLFIFSLPFAFLDILDVYYRYMFMMVGGGMFLILLSVLYLKNMYFIKFKSMDYIRTISKYIRLAGIKEDKSISVLIRSIFIHLFTVLIFIVISNSILLDIGWKSWLWIAPLTTLFMMVPISISGWGVREGVMMVAMGYVGVSTEDALFVSIVYGLVLLTSSMLSVALWLHSIEKVNIIPKFLKSIYIK